MSVRKLVSYYRSDDFENQKLSDDQYLSILEKHLIDLPQKEIEFFVNRKRFRLMRTLIGAELKTDIGSILDVATGPFAFENYVDYRDDTVIDSFDLNPMLDGVYVDMKATGKFGNLSYSCASAETFSTSKTYDLVLINDLFYHKSVDFYGLIQRFAELVKSGGLLYFDILDIRSKWLWSNLGKDAQFARYNLEDVVKELEKFDLTLESMTPSLGIGGMLDFTGRAAMYKILNLANNYILVARKK